MIMQMYPLLLSLALRGPSHALLAPVVVSTTHGLPGSAPMDTPRCPCTWHPVAIEEREAHLFACRIWPGPICGSCWAARR